jgi:hypothetical protein
MMLMEEKYAAWSGLITHNTGLLWRLTWSMIGGRTTRFMVMTFHAHDAAKVSKCDAKLRDNFDRLGAEIEEIAPAGEFFMVDTLPGLSEIALAIARSTEVLSRRILSRRLLPVPESHLDGRRACRKGC